MKKWIFLLVICFCYLPVYAMSVEQDVSDGVVRLHIRANSNSLEDQALKLKVRDRLIEAAQKSFGGGMDKEAFCADVTGYFSAWEQMAEAVLKDAGCEYGASVRLGKEYIPRKGYGGIVLPEGSYDALVVTLGEGKGENWWCVVYPPLCFTEETTGELSEEGKKILREQLSEESYQFISREGITIEYRFKAVELVQKLLHYK